MKMLDKIYVKDSLIRKLITRYKRNRKFHEIRNLKENPTHNQKQSTFYASKIVIQI